MRPYPPITKSLRAQGFCYEDGTAMMAGKWLKAKWVPATQRLSAVRYRTPWKEQFDPFPLTALKYILP